MPSTLMSRHLLGPAQRAMGLWFSRRYIEGERYACYNQTADEERRRRRPSGELASIGSCFR